MLELTFRSAVEAENAGICHSTSNYRHETRRISSHELIFVREGRLAMFEEERAFVVRAGEFLRLRPNALHGGTETYSGDLVFYWVHFRVPAFAGERSIKQRVSFGQHGVVSRPDHLTVLFRRFLDDQESGWLNPLLGNTLLQLIFLEVTAVEYTSGIDDRSPEALANKALAHIRSNLSEPLSTGQVAEELRCNPDYLGRIFKRSTGDTMTNAIHYQRIAKARNLLLDSKLHVDEISSACGFAGTTYFRRVFKRHVGMSPRAYRKLYGKRHVTKELDFDRASSHNAHTA
ncbi:MAG: helix-turn-helix domain-containing protein [Hyphomicrobiales bacterium]|nr:helix-turn-helix domain-containing protein [Hyphomicrobiales bacterium]